MRRRSLRNLAADNPSAILTLVFVGIYVATDIVNRAQGDGAFLTAKQVSTTFLFAAVLGLIAAGQTLVMLTGGVDQNYAQVIQGALIVLVVMVGGLAIRQKAKGT